MGISLALLAHILGTVLAGVLVYFISPYFAELIGAELTFVYLVLYSLLSVWSFREAKEIESGKNKKANQLSEILDKDDKE